MGLGVPFSLGFTYGLSTSVGLFVTPVNRNESLLVVFLLFLREALLHVPIRFGRYGGVFLTPRDAEFTASVDIFV